MVTLRVTGRGVPISTAGFTPLSPSV